MAKAKRKSSSAGEETRQRIVAATLETLHTEGIVGASARAIAREGGFNQALIFYHFGSVDEAIVAAIGELSDRRLDKYKSELVDVSTVSELISVARRIFSDDQESGEVGVLAQAFAGASNDPEMGPLIFAHIDRWNQFIAEVIDRVIAASPLGSSPLAAMLPRDELAFAISALFLGVELMSELDPQHIQADRIFSAIAALAQIGESLLANPDIARVLGGSTP